MLNKNRYSHQNLERVAIRAITILGLVSISSISGCQNANKIAQSPINQNKPEGNTRLEKIKNRGQLICGINDRLTGFSYKEDDGSYSGISVDLCRAIAAAMFNDPTKVKFKHLEAEERFKAVASGQVDILSRNTTWNLSRDTSEGLDFPPTNFYDGQGLLVKKDSGITDLNDLNGKSICLPVGTTTEDNLAEQMRKYNVGYLPMPFENNDELYRSYDAGKCDAATSDRSSLVARRVLLSDPDAHQVLNVVISKEPLGPVIANDEPAWFDVVKWVSYAMIKAEELNISSTNIESFSNTKNPEKRRFLGIEGDIGVQLGLSNEFAQRVVRQVGNYEEIYQRNMGEPFGLERGNNALWKDGGLMYSPPFR